MRHFHGTTHMRAMRGALCTDWEIKLSCRLTRYQKSTDSPMAATSPRTQQLGKPEPSSMAAARRTTTIINESLKSARKRPTTCGTLTPSGRSPSGFVKHSVLVRGRALFVVPTQDARGGEGVYELSMTRTWSRLTSGSLTGTSIRRLPGYRWLLSSADT